MVKSCDHTISDISNDGIEFNILDAKNTIRQMKQYLMCIYELLIMSLDNLIKLTIDTDNINDFNNEHLESVVKCVNMYVTEINSIVNNAQYNGRPLLADTHSTIKSLVFRIAQKTNYRSNNNKFNDFILELPIVGIQELDIEVYKTDFSNLFQM